MMQVSTPLPGLDADILAVGLAGLAGMPPEPDDLKNLQTAMGALDAFTGTSALTGTRAASPLMAEIVGIAAGVAAAILAEGTLSGGNPSGGDAAPALPWPDQDVLRDLAAAVQAVRRNRAGTGQAERATEAIPGGPRRGLPNPVALPVDGQICTLFAADIAGFTRPDRDDDIRRYLHEKLYEFLPKAFDDSGIPWAECLWEDRGDGALVVLPPGISAKGIIDPLPERLRILIRHHNHVSCPAAGLQLRTVAHIGPVEHDGHGFVGSDVNLLFRMLDARPLKRALAASGAEVALIVSDYVYRSLVSRYPSLMHPDAFRVMRFQVKRTKAQAWAYLPGVPS